MPGTLLHHHLFLKNKRNNYSGCIYKEEEGKIVSLCMWIIYRTIACSNYNRRYGCSHLLSLYSHYPPLFSAISPPFLHHFPMKPPPSSNSTHHHHFYPTSPAVNTPSLNYSVSLVFCLSMAIPHGQVCIWYFQYQPYSNSKQNHALFCSNLQAVTDSKQTQSFLLISFYLLSFRTLALTLESVGMHSAT